MRDFYDDPVAYRRQEDIFERAAGEHWRAETEQFRKRNALIDEQIAAEEAAAREAHRVKAMAFNAAVICAQYRDAGVEPIQVDGNGVPTVSLPMLLWIGWRIEEISGEKKLVLPVPAGHKIIKQGRREDYDQST